MSESDSRNLTLPLGDFGPLVIQPEEATESEIGRIRYVLFPDQIPANKFSEALEWAAASEAPVFCTASDLKRFEDEGFGSYRFHVLGGFREVGFEKGSLRFVPARRKHAAGWRGVLEDLADAWGWKRREAFHVIAKVPGKETVLYLATPFVDRSEWALLCEDKPTKVYGSAHFGLVYWASLAERLGTEIEARLAEEESRPSTKIFGSRDAADIVKSGRQQNAPKGGAAWKSVDRGSGS